MLTLKEKNIQKIKKKVNCTLKTCGIDNFPEESEILLCEAFNLKRFQLYTGDYEPGLGEIKKLKSWLGKRCQRIPLAYVINKAFFYGTEFYVDENVLIPRQETEILVDEILNICNSNKLDNIVIADLGTGCGNIAISLTKHLTSCKIMATDICPKALQVAKKNVERMGFETNIVLLQGDLFEPLKEYKNKIDILVSNPPYVSQSEMKKLSGEVKCEPRISLEAGNEGLDFYVRIIGEAISYLKPGGYIFLEIGNKQAQSALCLNQRRLLVSLKL
jgi:release factor glutamine methyltransferase